MSYTDLEDPTPGDRLAADAIETIIIPRAVDLGEMTVRRALPSLERQMVGPFIFFDQMGPAQFLTGQGIDVRPHPHINLATLTYLFEGEILHRDSLGTEQSIYPGEVNWMLAGRGIVHSERTREELRERGQELYGIQSWMALPERAEEAEPAFSHLGEMELPLLEAEGARARVIAGEVFGERSPLETASATLYADVTLAPAARVLLATDYTERAIYPVSGVVSIDGRDYKVGELVVLRPGARVEARSVDGGRFMFLGGEPMGGPRYIWWNFVSSRPERIEQAREEWASGRFDTVPGDAEEFIPLPSEVGTPRRALGGVYYP